MENEQEKSEQTDLPLTDKEEVITEVKSEKKEYDPTRFGDWEKNGRCIDF